MTQHVVVVHHSNQTVQSERMLGDRKQEERLDNGQIVIVPANVPHKLRWDGAGDFTLLMLEPTHFANIAYEVMDVDRVEIMPQFAMFDPLIYQTGLALKSQMEAGKRDRLYAESMAALLGAHLLRHYSTWEKTFQPCEGGIPTRQLRLVVDYIHAHLMDDLALETLTSLVQMSPFYFTRLFKQSTGMTPHRYIQHCRVERAKTLLHHREVTIAEVSQPGGFGSDRQFSTVFRKHTGISPRTYRERC